MLHRGLRTYRSPSSNRTFMELKCIITTAIYIFARGSNRTFMELKSHNNQDPRKPLAF